MTNGEAIRRIRQAKAKGATTLDLSRVIEGDQVPIPAELASLKKLTELYLDDNQLASLPSELGWLTSLRLLSLHNNQLTSLPSELGRLTSLDTLILGKNQLTSLPSEFGQLSSLKRLDLTDNQLTSLPSEFGQLSSLTRLDVIGNHLTSLPPELGRLEGLTHLTLLDNQLTSLPVELGRLKNLSLLTLGDNRLTSLPMELGQLKSLARLTLHGNRLTQLPSELGRLTGLETLQLHSNLLTSLPAELGGLTNLTALTLGGNRLVSLPVELGQLTSLKTLTLGDNLLRSLPAELGRLKNLTTLYLNGNQLTSLPVEFGQLTNLATLYLQNNQLTSLPAQLGQLTRLTTLYLHFNRLPEALAEAFGNGLDDLRSYLSSLSDPAVAENLYEAKLVLVGEGGVGKTSLLAAMLGREFVEDRATTHGMEIAQEPVVLEHPKLDVSLRLNAWDFGGQRVYRVTHQFFFSPRSVYLLLWSPRLGADACDVEGWIKTIRLRVGESAVGTSARIVIVATHAETGDRLPRLDETALRRDYGDVIVDFCEVDSKTTYGIDQLKIKIASAASELPQMGDPFNVHWKAARDEVLDLAKSEPRVTWRQFEEICERHTLDEQAARTLAALMNDVGHVVYFAEDEGLKKEIILQPEWLAKAIGYVLEDRTTNEELGELEHGRLRKIWYEHGKQDFECYHPALHPFFLRLMEKFDVSYRVPDRDVSLVAQLVPHERPELPNPADSLGIDLGLVCRMSEAPEGMVPWMIVRFQRFATNPRKHWQRGMYLEHGKHGSALLELQGAEMHMRVRGSYPQHFTSILSDSVEHLIHERWPGLDYDFAVPCPHRDGDGECAGRFLLSALHEAKAKGHDQYPCQECNEWQKVDVLLTGFEAAGSDIAGQIAKLQTSIGALRSESSDYASQAARMARVVLRALSTETRDCPRYYTIIPEKRKFRPSHLGKDPMRLTLWCEMPEDEHPTCRIGSDGDGEYTFTRPRDWLVRVAPYAKLVSTILGAALPVAGNLIGRTIDPKDIEAVSKDIDLMKDVASGVLDVAGELAPHVGSTVPAPDSGFHNMAEGDGLRQLHTLLVELDPGKQWGGLRRVLAPTGDYLWLCPKHHAEYDPGLPELPQ